MYTITGVTGNIGKVIAEKLLEKSQKVRAIGRDASRLKRLAELGAEISPGSLEDAEFLTKAFEGSSGLFAMIPPNLKTQNFGKYQDTIGEAITEALRRTAVRYVANLSSIGADVPAETGPIAGLHRQEIRLNQLDGSNILHLRPAYFMENFLGNIPLIKAMGINGSAFRADLLISMIATRDIGFHAAERLLTLDFQRKSVQYLLGPRDLTMTEATKILGRAIGKPDLQYVQFSYEDAENGIVQAGISRDVARSFVEMTKAFNDGVIGPVQRTPQNTTPTSLEEFARTVFAPAFES
jgi:uncharacterized protein YbjT (DUF2867 family)